MNGYSTFVRLNDIIVTKNIVVTIKEEQNHIYVKS